MTYHDSDLGKKTFYHAHYDPNKLFAIPRSEKRIEIGITGELPFFGFDLWNHYEVSWLNHKGKPIVALAEMYYDCATPFIIESKSMKLYFNSLNNTVFENEEAVAKLIKRDLSHKVGGEVEIKLKLLNTLSDSLIFSGFQGINLDELDIDCQIYTPTPTLLTTGQQYVTEMLHSNLLKSNCLVTHQPDWGSIHISYSGQEINKTGLLQYIVSYRNHNEFHEQCVERIFVDIMQYCQPDQLTVYARYTRRGGIDINPYRSTLNTWPHDLNTRLCRQ